MLIRELVLSFSLFEKYGPTGWPVGCRDMGLELRGRAVREGCRSEGLYCAWVGANTAPITDPAQRMAEARF